MDQYQERNYAPKIRKIEKSDFRKHCDGSKGGKACEASRCDCILQGKKNYKKEIDLNILPCEQGDENAKGSIFENQSDKNETLIINEGENSPKQRKRKSRKIKKDRKI